MGDDAGQSGSGGLRENVSVRAAYGDPATPPDGVPIVGRLGRGPGDGAWRIFDSADLISFFEVAEEDVLHAEDTTVNGQTLSTVWVKRGATVTQNVAAARSMTAELLEGALTEQARAAGFTGAERMEPECVTPTFGFSVAVTIRLCPRTPSIVHRVTQICPA